MADGVRRDFGWSEALRQLVAQAAFDTLLERFGRCVSLDREFSGAGWMALVCWDFRLAVLPGILCCAAVQTCELWLLCAAGTLRLACSVVRRPVLSSLQTLSARRFSLMPFDCLL